MHPATPIGDLGSMAPIMWAGLRSVWDAFSKDAGAVLITSIWQSAVIVCGLEIALRLMPRISAGHRFAVWAAGFGIAAGLPLLALIHFGGSAGSSGAGTTANALVRIDARWGLAIAGLWVVASAVRGTELLMHSIRLRQLWKTAKPVAVGVKLAAALKSVRHGGAGICTTEQLDRPSVIGFMAPRILIPAWLIERLTAGELEQIVLHEAEHLRRRDDWTNLAQKLALVVLPLNPALAWIEHRLCREREMACDEGVVRITNAPRAYAACLASLAEHGLERRAEALSLGAWHKRSELVHRVHGILMRKRGMSRTAAGALLATIGCALVAATVEMARAPELVAFVPEQKELAMTPARQPQMEAMLAQESAEAKIALPPGYHAEAAKAVVAASEGTLKRDRVKAATSGHARTAASATESAKTDVRGDRVNGEQQWIVLSAWEEVRTVSPASGSDQVADYDAGAMTASNPARTNGAANDPAGQSKAKTRSQAAGSYTFTQLILRVVPANPGSNSSQPTIGMVRGGWFVIQL